MSWYLDLNLARQERYYLCSHSWGCKREGAHNLNRSLWYGTSTPEVGITHFVLCNLQGFTEGRKHLKVKWHTSFGVLQPWLIHDWRHVFWPSKGTLSLGIRATTPVRYAISSRKQFLAGFRTCPPRQSRNWKEGRDGAEVFPRSVKRANSKNVSNNFPTSPRLWSRSTRIRVYVV